jgi:hypothetical protein
MNKAEISIGDVLHLYVEEFKKYKFFIILGENDAEFTFASFYINSEKNYNFIPHKEAEKFHIKLSPSEYSFLNHDSWLNLTEIFPKSKDHIINEYNRDNSCLKFSLNEIQLEFFRDCVRNCGMIKGKFKKKFNFYD